MEHPTEIARADGIILGSDPLSLHEGLVSLSTLKPSPNFKPLHPISRKGLFLAGRAALLALALAIVGAAVLVGMAVDLICLSPPFQDSDPAVSAMRRWIPI